MTFRKIYFNGFLLTTEAWNVESMPFSVPERRGDNVTVPYRNGARHVRNKPFGQRRPVLNMWVAPTDANGVLIEGRTEREQLELNLEYLKSIFAVSGQVTLRVQMLDGSYRAAQLEVVNEISFVKEQPTVSAKMSVELLFADPLYYGETLVTETVELTSGSVSIALNNVGTTRVEKGNIRITGPASNLKINNTTNGISCTFTGIIDVGEEVFIDLDSHEVTLDEENVLGYLIHAGDPHWFVLNAGGNNMELTCDTFGGSVEFNYYPPYV